MLEDEIPQVDVWTWQDKMIQPRQEAELKTLLKKAFISYFNIENNQFIHLQDKKIDVLMFDQNRKQTYILAFDNIIYSLESSWDRPKRRDCYIINTKTGEKRLAVKNTSARFRLTPDGNFALYFDRDQKHWFSLSLMDAKKTNLTKDLKVAFQDEEYDRPSIAPTYGFGGFDNVGNALVYDKYDIWKLSVNGLGKPINITKRGKRKNVTYRTLQLDNENKDLASYKRDKLLITSFNNQTKVSGLYVFFNDKLIEKIAPSNYYISNFIKSKEGAVLTYTKENFNTFPDIHYLKDEVNLKITSINPQQKEFRWGTAELYHWKAFDGTKLEGLLYKPKHFDPSKKYPLITYFYEKLSDDLCKYKIPKPSASTVNPSYLVSNDYILFVPNIVYGIGRSGEDAFNCIISGVEKLEKTGFIDSNKMALQGQSWGGYQTAYLITVTTKFKAAMAGAPVSNMTSAYGGVRWKTGQSRAWQYEKAQSRLGKNLWEGLDMYIENSPLFNVPKIETPLLIMHNDKDGAVPYYQGIELFMGMRRLQKPAWLLVYNDEGHNLKKTKNKQDLSIRMMQFFDHFLKDEQAPEWMSIGIPRIQKNINLGYTLNEK